MAERLHVVAAVIADHSGSVLLSHRAAHLHQGGLWEFPGGKVEPGETVEEALVRELREELGIVPDSFRPLLRIPYDYSDRNVLLDVWVVSRYTGTLHGAEGQTVRWVERDALSRYQFPKANVPIITAVHLPDRYLITPEPGPSKNELDEFLTHLGKSIAGGNMLVQFRVKSITGDKYIKLATEATRICHENGSKMLLNSSAELAVKLGADGVHLSSALLKSLVARPVSDDMLVAASCHDKNELDHAVALGCDFAVLSPVKQTRSHPASPAIGWENFRNLVDGAALPVYALGGMTLDDLETSWKYGAQGIAGISGLW